MNQASLFLIVAALTGAMSSRWMVRLAPLMSELPLKTIGAAVLAGLVGAGEGGLLAFQPSSALLIFALVAAPLYIFAPLALVGLARARRYGLANGVADLLYWTEAGRSGVKRLLVQIALQQGDANAALTFLPENQTDQLMLAQAYALEEKWDKVLALQVPEAGDNALLGMAARVEAYLALGRLNDAESEVARMRERHSASQGPVGYRSIVLSEARVAAERGQFEAVRTGLQGAPPGIPPYLVFGLVARAAEQAGHPDDAVRLYRQAYSAAPPGKRPLYAERLTSYGQSLPRPERAEKPFGTFGLLVAIILAYLVQAWLDNNYGPNTAFLAGSFTLNISGVPQADALWRYLSYGFLHGGIVHLGFNAWVLFDIGRLYEARRSWGNLLASFVFGTVMGAYLTLLAQGSDQLLLVGASGGVLGIAGALLADTWRGRSPQDRLMTRSLVQWMVIIVLFSLAIPNVSLWGHVGGVVGGLLWGFLRQGLPASRSFDLFVGGLSIGLMAYALLQAANVLLRVI